MHAHSFLKAVLELTHAKELTERHIPCLRLVGLELALHGFHLLQLGVVGLLALSSDSSKHIGNLTVISFKILFQMLDILLTESYQA